MRCIEPVEMRCIEPVEMRCLEPVEMPKPSTGNKTTHPKTKKPKHIFSAFCGDDETRTRDPRRDRPVF
jgi:hypothetical protein